MILDTMTPKSVARTVYTTVLQRTVYTKKLCKDRLHYSVAVTYFRVFFLFRRKENGEAGGTAVFGGQVAQNPRPAHEHDEYEQPLHHVDHVEHNPKEKEMFKQCY